MSAGAQYRYLFRPLRLGPVTIPNRVVFAAHLTNYAENGRPSEQHAAYYEARARGGVNPMTLVDRVKEIWNRHAGG